MSSVTFELPEYKTILPTWQLMDDVCAGETAVKAAKETYLPKPNPDDKSKRNESRYENYLKRSVFYNVTGRTAHGLAGAAFRKDPEIVVPKLLEYVYKNIDGAGNTIAQQARRVVMKLLCNGRAGMLVDSAESGGLPRLLIYDAKSIINWQLTTLDDEQVLSRVVLAEKIKEYDRDGFGFEEVAQWRELFLEDGYYSVRLWRKAEKTDDYVVIEQFWPTTAKGNQLDRIPFIFAGSVNNDADIDPIPLYDIAAINLAHYRNSADYEDSVYLVGQAQPWISGLDIEWRDHLEQKQVYFGSGTVIPIPAGGAMGLEQAGANSMAQEAMQNKEKQMISLGARVVERGSGAHTATQERNENEVEHSVLSLIVQNVSEAYEYALSLMAEFISVNGEIRFKINTDFHNYSPDPQLLAAVNQVYATGKLPDLDYWAFLKKYSVIDAERDIDDIRDETEANSPLGLDDGVN